MTPFLWSRPLATTGNAPANGLVVAAAPPTQGAINVPISRTACVVRSCYVYNATASTNAWFAFFNLPTIATSFTNMIGGLILVPFATAVILTQADWFGPGWDLFPNGCSVAVTTSQTAWTAAGANYTIQVNGE